MDGCWLLLLLLATAAAAAAAGGGVVVAVAMVSIVLAPMLKLNFSFLSS
jgi:hypothetical protein